MVEVVPVTTIRWAGARRASFRLVLADGQILKGRRLNAPEDVARVVHLSSLLDPRYFPPVLAHRGSALLTRWISGQPLPPAEWTPGDLRVAAGLQTSLHRLPVSSDLAAQPFAAAPWTERLDRWLGELVGHGALALRVSGEIARQVVDSAPDTVHLGVCHTDFCADNIVAPEAGKICVVDNEGLCLDAPEFDLARTWYRWPMTATQQRAYGDGYAARDHAARFGAHFLHWALLAVLDSAAYRVRVGHAGARIPLDRLAELRRTHGRDEPLPRFLAGGSP